MKFSLLDSMINDPYDGMNPPHLINAATLPCESQKPKMHVNTTSAFNVNYKIAIACIKLH